MDKKIAHEIRRVDVGQRELHLEVYYPREISRAPGILLLHEVYGLKNWYRKDAADLAERGFLVYLPDLYSGEAIKYCIRAIILTAGRKNRSSSSTNQEVHKLLDILGNDLRCSGQLGMLGACLSGGFVLQMAKRKDMLAPVVYHHSLGTEGVGIPNKENLDDIRCLQGHWASKDIFCPPRRRDELIEALGDRVEAYTYDMPHGFRSRSRKHPLSNVVWQRTVDFFERELKG